MSQAKRDRKDSDNEELLEEESIPQMKSLESFKIVSASRASFVKIHNFD